ncbi:MAG: preprotein translocase subunit SecG [Candidatus Peregrinibacteria bacterium]
MKNILLISHVVTSVLLMVLILTQNKEGGLTAAVMGAGRGGFRATRRGAEKVIFVATIVFAFLFLVNALLFVFI